MLANEYISNTWLLKLFSFKSVEDIKEDVKNITQKISIIDLLKL